MVPHDVPLVNASTVITAMITQHRHRPFSRRSNGIEAERADADLHDMITAATEYSTA